jgi:4'-phosphopantetheinyl transferase
MAFGSDGQAPAVIELWIATATEQLAASWRHAVPEAALRNLTAVREVERNRRVVQMALRRTVFAAHVGCPLQEVELAADANGRIIFPSPEMVVSASHHDDITVLAVADAPRALGVDVEPVEESGWDDAVGDVLSSEELSALAALPASRRPSSYFRAWTLKEAVMKALGEGLSERDPKTIEVNMAPGCARLLALDGQTPIGWALRTTRLEQHVCSLAAVGVEEMTIARRDWPLDLPPNMR